MDKTRYALPVGKIRVLETKLLERDFLARLIEADDFSQAVSIMKETAYADLLDDKFNFARVDERFDLYLLGVKELLISLACEKEIIAGFFLKYDLLNMLLLLKDIENENLSPLGNLKAPQLRDFLKGEGGLSLPLEFKEILLKVKKSPERVDEEYFNYLKRIAKKYSSAWFSGLVSKLALRENYSVLVKHLKESRLVAFGVEPLLAYFLYKELEIRALRVILTAKFNGVEKEAIHERIFR